LRIIFLIAFAIATFSKSLIAGDTLRHIDTELQKQIRDAEIIAQLFSNVDRLCRLREGYDSWDFDYKLNNVRISRFINPGDSLMIIGLNDTLELKKKMQNMLKSDSLASPSLFSDSSLKCELVYVDVRRIIKLMVKNKFLSLSFGGIGDCTSCSVKIIYKWNKNVKRGDGFVVELNNWCGSDDNCYERAEGEEIEKIKEKIFIVKNSMYFGFESHTWQRRLK
jgi:hypothetical protein